MQTQMAHNVTDELAHDCDRETPVAGCEMHHLLGQDVSRKSEKGNQK